MPRRLTIEDYKKICGDRGEWVDMNFPKTNHTDTQWMCWACGNVFEMSYHCVQQGRWCKPCGIKKQAESQRLTAKDYKSICRDRGEWRDIKTPQNTKIRTSWICFNCGKMFKMAYDVVYRGGWCSSCGRKKTAKALRLTIDDYNAVCKKKGIWTGSFLPDNCDIKTEWKCFGCGEIFGARYDSIKQGQWCSVCSKSRSEKMVRSIFESYFHVAFPSQRPKWLLNYTGHKLELDGYNEDLNLAFEYQGEQHYRYNKRWHRTKQRFEDQKYRDFIKKELCSIFGIRLIVIPYTYSCYNEDKLKEFLYAQFKTI